MCGNSVKTSSKGTSYLTELPELLSDRCFHITQNLFIILFIIYLFASIVFFFESATKLFHFESKKNKERKKMALFSPSVSNFDVIS